MNIPYWGHIGATNLTPYGHLRQLREVQRRSARRARRSQFRTTNALEAEIDELRGDLEFVTLTLASLLTELDHRGSITREDLRSVMIAVDEYDGELDGRLPVKALEELMRPPVLDDPDVD